MKKEKIPTYTQTLFMETFENIEHNYNNRQDFSGLATGFHNLDIILSGLHKSELIVIAGRPSMGKTSLCLNIAENIAVNAKKSVLIFSLEAKGSKIIQRLLATNAKIDNSKLRSGHMQTEDWLKLTESIKALANAPITIEEKKDLSFDDIEKAVRSFIEENDDLGLVIIDYMQLIKIDKNKDRVQAFSQLSRDLKMLAMNFDIPVIVASQLSRNLETRLNKKPLLPDLSESGAIEQHADVVLMLYRDEYYNPENTENKGEAEIIIAKQRHGPIGTTDLSFQSNITKFQTHTNKMVDF